MSQKCQMNALGKLTALKIDMLFASNYSVLVPSQALNKEVYKHSNGYINWVIKYNLVVGYQICHCLHEHKPFIGTGKNDVGWLIKLLAGWKVKTCTTGLLI